MIRHVGWVEPKAKPVSARAVGTSRSVSLVLNPSYFFAYYLFCCVAFTSIPAQAAIGQDGTSLSISMVQQIGCTGAEGKEEHSGCKLLAEVDLDEYFPVHARSMFTVTQEQNGNVPGSAGDLTFCFLKNGIPSCGYNLSAHIQTIGRVAPVPNYPLNKLISASVVFPSQNALYPILFVRAQTDDNSPARVLIYTIIWAYNPTAHRFDQIWFNASNPKLNEETRLVTDGPLAGNLVVAATWLHSEPYEIRVFNLNPLLGYSQIVYLPESYEKRPGTPVGPGIDRNMKEILRQLELSEEPSGLAVSSTTGDYEGGWGIAYGVLEYYGFDTAAKLLTKGVIEKVHACPFSKKDEADFDRWIITEQAVVETDLQYGQNRLTAPDKRPDLGDGEASRVDADKLAKILIKDYRSVFGGTQPCLVGSGPDL